jgi:hypothetical protein
LLGMEPPAAAAGGAGTATTGGGAQPSQTLQYPRPQQ